jgi:hypothetical protein
MELENMLNERDNDTKLTIAVMQTQAAQEEGIQE